MSGGPYEIAGGVGPVAHPWNHTIHARIPRPAAIMADLRIDRFRPLVVVQRARFCRAVDRATAEPRADHAVKARIFAGAVLKGCMRAR